MRRFRPVLVGVFFLHGRGGGGRGLRGPTWVNRVRECMVWRAVKMSLFLMEGQQSSQHTDDEEW